MPGMTITTLATQVLSCIVGHLQQDAWQRDQRLRDVAALRSVCHLLRNAVDHIVTHAAFHAYVDVAQLLSSIRRCTGDAHWTSYRTYVRAVCSHSVGSFKVVHGHLMQ